MGHRVGMRMRHASVALKTVQDRVVYAEETPDQECAQRMLNDVCSHRHSQSTWHPCFTCCSHTVHDVAEHEIMLVHYALGSSPLLSYSLMALSDLGPPCFPWHSGDFEGD